MNLTLLIYTHNIGAHCHRPAMRPNCIFFPEVLFLVEELAGNGCYLKIVVADEADDSVALRAFTDVALYAPQGIERGGVALIYVAIAFGYVVNHLFVESFVAQDECIYTVVGDRVVGHHRVRGHVAVDTASAFYQYPLTYVAAFMNQSV